MARTTPAQQSPRRRLRDACPARCATVRPLPTHPREWAPRLSPLALPTRACSERSSTVAQAGMQSGPAATWVGASGRPGQPGTRPARGRARGWGRPLVPVRLPAGRRGSDRPSPSRRFGRGPRRPRNQSPASQAPVPLIESRVPRSLCPFPARTIRPCRRPINGSCGMVERSQTRSRAGTGRALRTQRCPVHSAPATAPGRERSLPKPQHPREHCLTSLGGWAFPGSQADGARADWPPPLAPRGCGLGGARQRVADERDANGRARSGASATRRGTPALFRGLGADGRGRPGGVHSWRGPG